MSANGILVWNIDTTKANVTEQNEQNTIPQNNNTINKTTCKAKQTVNIYIYRHKEKNATLRLSIQRM